MVTKYKMESVKTMNIGIIGLGRMGKNHLRVLTSLRSSINDISIYDSNINTMIEMSKIYDVKYYKDIEGFLDSVNAVIICTPTTTHYNLAKKCIDKDKDILLEKPITSTIQEANELIKYIKNKNVICMVGHVERFNPAILYLTEYLKTKKVLSISASRISKIEYGRNFDVDVVTDLMIHDIDIILSIINSRLSKIFAASYDENLDNMLAMMQFDNGVTSNLEASRTSQEKIRKLDITTSYESIHVDYIKSKIDIVKLCDIKCPIGENNDYRIVGKEESLYFEGEPLKIELQHFIECITERKKPISNEETGYMALNVAGEILNCISKKRL